MKKEDQKIRRFEDGSELVIGALIEVHRALGPGLLESAYESCFCHELALRDLPFERQVAVPLLYKDVAIDCGYRIDVVIDRRIIVELKAIEALAHVHTAQLFTYMRLSGISVGLLVNFNVTTLRNGLRRFDLPFPDAPPPT